MLHISMIMDLAAKMGIWPCLAFLKTQQLVSVRFRILVTCLILVFFLGLFLKYFFTHLEVIMITRVLELQLITIIPFGL